MSLPRSVTKTKIKKGQMEVTFVDSVDRVNYTIQELIQRANSDVGTYLAKACNAAARAELPGVSKTRRVGTRIKVAAFQYWARPKEGDLQIGVKHDTWYGAAQELGEDGMPKIGIIRSTVSENINQIRDIQAQYLSSIADERAAEKLVEEAERMSETAND